MQSNEHVLGGVFSGACCGIVTGTHTSPKLTPHRDPSCHSPSSRTLVLGIGCPCPSLSPVLASHCCSPMVWGYHDPQTPPACTPARPDLPCTPSCPQASSTHVLLSVTSFPGRGHLGTRLDPQLVLVQGSDAGRCCSPTFFSPHPVTPQKCCPGRDATSEPARG